MNKRIFKTMGLLLIIIGYSIFYRMYIFNHMLKYSESITASFIILLTFTAVLLLGLRRCRYNKIRKYLTNMTLILIAIFFILSYACGLFVGYLKNSYSLALPTLINNIFSPIIVIVCTEILRYVLISSNKDKKYIVFLSTIVITIFELAITIRAVNMTDFLGIFKIFTSTALPIISKNIVLSYLAYQVNFVPGILYRLVMDIYPFVMPVVPDLGDYLNSMIGIALPFLIYIYAVRSVEEFEHGAENNFSRYSFRLIDIPAAIFLIVLICLISGFFPYYMIGIGSGSMEPKISKGDAVIIHKIKSGKGLKVGQIIAFKQKEKTIIHRLVEIEKVNGTVYYHTKGDANNSVDSINLTIKDIQGTVEVTIPYIAYPTIYLTEFLNGER